MRALCVLVLLGGAIGLRAEPGEITVAPDQLFRSTGPEVRFRCGSEQLRAKLRNGRLVVQTASGERVILTPVAEPRAVPQTPAYGDGKLTLYKLREPQVWALSRADRPGQPVEHCIPQRRLP